MRYSRTHLYTILSDLSRFAFLLIIPLLQALLADYRTSFQRISALGTNLFFTVTLVTVSVLRWRAGGYCAGEKSFFAKQGLLLRQKMRIPYRQVDAVMMERSVLLSLFGAARLYIDTAAGSGKKTDLKLTVPVKTALKLCDRLTKDGQWLYRAPTFRILLMAASWSNPAAGLLIAAPFINKLGDVLGHEISERLYSTVNLSMQLAAWGIPPLAAAVGYVLVAGWVVALLVQVSRYANFTVGLGNDAVLIKRGLISVGRQVISIPAIGAISIRQTLLMRVFRLYSAYVHTVGSGKTKGDRSLLLAAAGKEELESVISKILPLPSENTHTVTLPRFVKLGFLFPAIAVAVVAAVLCPLPLFFGLDPGFSIILAAFAVPFTVWYFFLRLAAFKTSRLSVSEHSMTLCTFRGMTLYMAVIPYRQVQVIEYLQNPLQKRVGLCTLKVYIRSEDGESFALYGVNKDEVESVLKGANS